MDQRSLKFLLEQCITTPEQQKWVAKLLGYDYEITYRPRRENFAADALSRKQGSSVLHHLFVSQVTLWEEIKQGAKTNLYIQSMSQVAVNQLHSHFVWRNGLLRVARERRRGDRPPTKNK
jgi:hypothetical protein